MKIIPLGLMFETIEGGFLDIDVRIVGPDGKVIYQGNRETNGKCKYLHILQIYTYPLHFYDFRHICCLRDGSLHLLLQQSNVDSHTESSYVHDGNLRSPSWNTGSAG